MLVNGRLFGDFQLTITGTAKDLGSSSNAKQEQNFIVEIETKVCDQGVARRRRYVVLLIFTI